MVFNHYYHIISRNVYTNIEYYDTSYHNRPFSRYDVNTWGYTVILPRRLSGPQGGATESSIPVMNPQLWVLLGLDRIAVAQVLQLLP